MQKWEYCRVSVHGPLSNTDGQLTILYYKPNFELEVVLATEPKTKRTEQWVAGSERLEQRFIEVCARLGLDGWELVEANEHIHYFKRPIIESTTT